MIAIYVFILAGPVPRRFSVWPARYGVPDVLVARSGILLGVYDKIYPRHNCRF